ncbi:hypothetical protein BX02_15710 [Escherichia coli O145:NM str. 08-4270]|nr:hypothetical protein BX02_15710 [Escherichia coli O145:NM str. 08-4270]
MRKLCAAILSAVVWQVAAATPASAAEHQSTLSAGYLHASTNVPGSDDLNGINVKYRYRQSLNGIVHFCDAAWIASHTTFFTDSSVGNTLRFLMACRITLFSDSMAFVV